MEEFRSSRRRFLMGTGAWMGAAAMGCGEPGGRTKTISIFHTTDLHGHIVPTKTYGGVADVGGFARCVSCIRQWRREAPDSLLVDIGDVYQGTAESLLNRGAMMVGLFNRLEYDAWVLGNHDFDWGPEALEANLELSKSPVLTGNLEKGGKQVGGLEGAWRKVRPWVMKEVGGVRVALVGVVTPGLPYWLPRETLGGVMPTDPVVSLKRSIAEARAEKADVVVVMGHMGWRKEDDFANPVVEMLKENPEVDVLLAGHTHQDRASWEVGGTLCSQASYYGIHCGRVDLTVDLDRRRVVAKRAMTLLMDKRFDLDPLVMEVTEPERRGAEEQLARKVGRVTAVIPGKGRGNRLAGLFCEMFGEALSRNGTPVDGVFHGTFGTGDLVPGDVTVGDCWTMLPYENLLTVAEVSAKELIEIVAEDRKESGSDRLLWPFEVELSRSGEVLRFLYQGEAVAVDRRFRIGFNSYDAQSGGQRLMRLREILESPGAKRVATQVETRTALVEGMLKRGEIS